MIVHMNYQQYRTARRRRNSTFRAVFRPVRFRQIVAAAENAFLSVCPVEQGGELKEGFYNSETMVVLESMPDGLLYSNLLLKMYLMSLKSGGILMLNEHLPHTVQTIATFTRHQIGTVERAIKVFAAKRAGVFPLSILYTLISILFISNL